MMCQHLCRLCICARLCLPESRSFLLKGKGIFQVKKVCTSEKMCAQSLVHPRVLEQVVSCRDDIAQQYLMQCIIQGFPDDFHLGTLSGLLATLPQLQPGVRVHVILSSLLDRLARWGLEYLYSS